MSSSSSEISIHVTHKSSHYLLTSLPSETLAIFQSRLEELTSVPPPFQKLLYKGKQSKLNAEDTLEDAGLRHGTKVMLIGSTKQELDDEQAAQAKKRRQDEILSQRAAKGPSKVRSTASPSQASADFTFHQLQPLAHLPSPESALALLKRLSSDPAIAHVMRLHRFSIGLLTELAPHEHPDVLGLNENRGQVIKLRLRTDAYDGFRSYGDVRRVLCHELTHCVWGTHDDNFKSLNSQLNREVAEFERATIQGSHTLNGGAAMYEPEVEVEALSGISGGSYILGGEHSMIPPGSDSREERRRRILDAAAARLRKEEEVIEEMCGSGNVVNAQHTKQE